MKECSFPECEGYQFAIVFDVPGFEKLRLKLAVAIPRYQPVVNAISRGQAERSA